jgi:plastocyanin
MTTRSGLSPHTSTRSASAVSRRLICGCAFAALIACAACARDDAAATRDTPPADDLLDRITRSADGGSVHLVRIIHRPDHYRFDPATVTVVPGDVVRFVLAGSLPESVVFDPSEATPEAAEFIHSRSMHLGVLLVEPGQSYDFEFKDAPPGRYPFLSIPRSGSGMTGSVDVVAPTAH